MLEACRASDVRLMIGYRKYFEPASLELKKLITSGKLGRLKYIHSAFGIVIRVRGKAGAWHLDPKLAGGGALPDVGVYCVNTIRWLVGKEPLEVSAYQWTTDPETFSKVDENIAFRLNFPEGIVAQATASFSAAESSFLQVHGEKGWAALNPAYPYDEERCLFGRLAAAGSRRSSRSLTSCRWSSMPLPTPSAASASPNRTASKGCATWP